MCKKREVFVGHWDNVEKEGEKHNQYLRKQSGFVLENTKCLILSSVQAEMS